MILTAEAIHAINEHFRLADLAEDTFHQGENAVKHLDDSTAYRAQVSDQEMNAYLDGNILPPHIAGEVAHQKSVAEYYAASRD